MTVLNVNLRETKPVPRFDTLDLDQILATVTPDEFDLAVYLDLANVQQNATVPTEGEQVITFTFQPQGVPYAARVTGGQPGSANPDDLTVTYSNAYSSGDLIDPETPLLTHHRRQITFGDLSMAFRAIAAEMWNRSS